MKKEKNHQLLRKAATEKSLKKKKQKSYHFTFSLGPKIKYL